MQINLPHFLQDLSKAAAHRESLKGMKDEYVRIHGSDALIPNRKYPIPWELVNALTSFKGYCGSEKVDYHSRKWCSIRAACATCRATGHRKAEIMTNPEENLLLTFSSLVWYKDGNEVYDPPPGFFDNPDSSLVACLAPNPAKADSDNSFFGFFRSYSRWQPSTSNMAYCLAELERQFPVRGRDRQHTPLFCNSNASGFSQSQLDTIMKKMLTAISVEQPHILKPEHITRYSWHSFRRALATALRRNNVSDSIIQAVCRWKSPQSLRIYAEIDMEQHCELVSSSLQVSFPIVHGNHPRIDEDDEAEALPHLIQEMNAVDSA